MEQVMWFSPGGSRVQQALLAALDWAERFHVVADRVRDPASDVFWAGIGAHSAKISTLSVWHPESVGGHPLLEGLVERAALRGAPAGIGGHSTFVWCERADELQLLLAAGAPEGAALLGPSLWMYWAGNRARLPDGLLVILESLLEASVPWTASPKALGDAEASEAIAYSRPIPSVREVLGLRSPRDVFELELEQQQLALWSALIGEGPVDLEQAIRLCATRLRAQGFLSYQALRQDGRVYAAIEETLLTARRGTDLFDRPKNGYVRAVERNLDRLTAEHWRDCLLGSLEQGMRVDRDEAVRLGFDYAIAIYGIEAQRLRVGGRADQALRSAINSAIRQGYLSRDGAAYLLCMTEKTAPTLRGVVEERADTTPPDEVAPPSAAHPEPTRGQGNGGLGLDRALDELDFPARALHWFDRSSLVTVRDLVSWSPTDFANEKNVGRRTVRETRELLEALLGTTWEDARAALKRGESPVVQSPGVAGEVDAATEALIAGGPTGWANLNQTINEADRAVPLVDVELPGRMRTFTQSAGIEQVGQLLAIPYAELAARDNLGRKSLNDTLDAIREALAERNAPPVHPTFLQAWQAHLSGLEAIPRMIVTRRAGMHGARETLEELGTMLGVSRERVRQIEARTLDRFRVRARWRRAVEANLLAAFGSSRALPLELLAQDSWWAGIDQHELLLDYVARRIFEDELFLLVGPTGKRYIAKFSQEALDAQLESARSRVAKLEYPVEAAAIDEILRSEAAALDPILLGEFEQHVEPLLHRNENNRHQVLAYGRYRDTEVIAFLAAQPEPVPVGLLEERLGRGRLPEEVLYFKRGLVGLKRHFPDFDAWLTQLVPAALEVMKERPAGRQWLVPEIHDALQEKGVLPNWLGHWHLASLLRVSGQVDYLGRLRVAAKGSGFEERLLFDEALEQALLDAEKPLSFADLLTRVRQRTDISEQTAALIIKEAPFVRLDEELIGLVERDIPGGPTALAAAVESVIQRLSETERGLTPYQATLLVQALSPEHAAWSRQLVTSVLRNEASLRIDRSRNIGLDAWDDVRCPTRGEFVRRAVQQAGGSIPIDELNAQMQPIYGRAVDRGALHALAAEIGHAVQGDRVVRPDSDLLEAAPPSRSPLHLGGVPVELRQMVEDLLRAPLSTPAELRAKVQEHVRDIEREHEVNEFVDLPGAHLLGKQCDELLGRWESMTDADRHAAHAAVSYFVSWDDYDNDLNIGGLDDDKQVMNAVLAHLGLESAGHAAATG